jgi:hypothetical protein
MVGLESRMATALVQRVIGMPESASLFLCGTTWVHLLAVVVEVSNPPSHLKSHCFHSLLCTRLVRSCPRRFQLDHSDRNSPQTQTNKGHKCSTTGSLKTDERLNIARSEGSCAAIHRQDATLMLALQNVDTHTSFRKLVSPDFICTAIEKHTLASDTSLKFTTTTSAVSFPSIILLKSGNLETWKVV